MIRIIATALLASACGAYETEPVGPEPVSEVVWSSEFIGGSDVHGCPVPELIDYRLDIRSTSAVACASVLHTVHRGQTGFWMAQLDAECLRDGREKIALGWLRTDTGHDLATTAKPFPAVTDGDALILKLEQNWSEDCRFDLSVTWELVTNVAAWDPYPTDSASSSK